MAAAATNPVPKRKAQTWDVFSVARALNEDLYAARKLSGGDELSFLLGLWQRTLAAPRKPKSPAPAEVRLSYAQIARIIGARGKYAVDVVQRLVTRLKKAGIIASRKEGKDQVLWYRLTPERWAAAPVYEPPKPTAVVELSVEVESSDEQTADQLALAGMEHLALATKQARAVKLDSPITDVSFRNELSVAIGIDRRMRNGGVQFVLRNAGAPDLQVGGHNSRHGAVTPDLQVGGQKLSHAVMTETFLAAMSKRGYAVAPDFGRISLAAMGWPDLDFVLGKVDDSIARCRAKRTRFLPAWLKTTIAADVQATWPAEKARRAAEAKPPRSNAGERCPDCGRLWAEGCRCVPGVGTKGRAS